MSPCLNARCQSDTRYKLFSGDIQSSKIAAASPEEDCTKKPHRTINLTQVDERVFKTTFSNVRI